MGIKGIHGAGFLKSTKFVLQFAGMLYVGLTQGEQVAQVDESAFDSSIKIEDEQNVKENSAFALVRNERGNVELRRKDNGLKMIEFPKDISENLNEEFIYDEEEYDKTFDKKISQDIAIIDGKAYRRVLDDNTGKVKEFIEIDTINRELFNKIEGNQEFCDLLNILSNGEITVKVEGENEKGEVLFGLCDFEKGIMKTADAKTIASMYFSELGYTKQGLEKIFGKARDVKEEQFEQDELIITQGINLKQTMYNSEVIKKCCIKTKNGYIVENADELVSETREEALVDITDKIDQINDNGNDTLKIKAIDYLCDDENVPDEYVAKYYDFLCQGMKDSKFRHTYINKLEKTTETKIENELVSMGYFSEDIEKLTKEDKILLLQNKSIELDQKSYEEMTKREDNKLTKDYLRVCEEITLLKQIDIYKATNELLDKVEEREKEEEKERKLREKQEIKETEAAMKILGAKDMVKINKSYTKGRNTMDGQEAFYMTEDGEIVFGEEIIAEKRKYEKQEVEVKQSASSIELTEDDFNNGDVSDLASSEELDNIEIGEQTNLFDYFENTNTNEVQIDSAEFDR